MKVRECLYAVLGGIVGAVVTLSVCSFTPLGAQSGEDSNFDVITCRELKVVDSEGKQRVRLMGYPEGGIVAACDSNGNLRRNN